MSLDTLINVGIGGLALLVLLPFMDRLRSMNWRTHQAPVVGMHLGLAVWLGFVAFHGLVVHDLEDGHDLLAVCSCACWIWLSRGTWRNGPPHHTETQPAPLDALPARNRS